MDFTAIPWLRAHMDADTRSLINQLAARAGMAMEDACTDAILIGSHQSEDVPAVLADIAKKIDQSKLLLAAARSLYE